MAAPSPTLHPIEVPCAHCGLPVPGGDPERAAPQFCCHGCRAVHHMMAEAGLGDFYALRDRLGAAPAGVAATPAVDDPYSRYDDPGFAAEFVRAVGDDLAAELHVDGVHCMACVWVMEQLPRVCPGVEQARLDFGRQRLALRWRPGQTSLAAVARLLDRLGYATRPLGAEAEAARRRADRAALIRVAAMLAVAGNSMMVAFAVYAGAFNGMEARFARFFEWLSLILAIPAVTYGAWPFYRGAWSGLRLRVPHIDLPIALGILASFGASVIATVRGTGAVYFDTVTALVALLLVGRYIQSRGQRAVMSRSEMLSALTPGRVRRRVGATVERVPATAIRAGDRLLVEVGDTVPADGVVRRSAGHVDQRLLTGESRPVAVRPGDQVFAGTVCLDGPIELVVTASGARSRLGRLVELIDQADGRRAPILRAADQLSGWFVAAVLLLAAVGGVTWSVIDPSRAFDVVVALLVVSCPCALGMATPVALAVARRRAAEAGVIARSTAAIERLAAVERVWFDKTGTLTEGRMQVTAGCVPADLHPVLAAIEQQSAHPVGRAIAAWALARTTDAAVAAVALDELVERAGAGISARVGRQRVFIGALDDAGPFSRPIADALARGETPVGVCVDGQPVGFLALGDRVRADARPALDRLRVAGIELGLLSGDHPRVVHTVARALGIVDAWGAQSPEDKAAVLGAGGRHVAMVGDGFNDAPALRAAPVGVAVHGGAEVALQVADIYLTRPGAAAVVDAIEGARRAMRVVRRGLAISLVYNAIFASLALVGLISPLVAAVIMPISSITVIAHAVLAPGFARSGPARDDRAVSIE